MNKSPSTYLGLTGGVVLAFLLAGLFTLDDYGMGWDEVTRWQSGDLKIAYYQQLFSGNGSDLGPAMAQDRYPGLFDMPLALVHQITGGNRMLMGHGLSLLFGCAGLIATAWMAHLLFGAKVAFIATLILAVFPNVYGHAMINPKDIPFMAMYTLGLAAVLSIAKDLILHRKVSIRQYILCGLVVGLAASCRVPGMILIALAGLAWISAICWNRTARVHRPDLLRDAIRLAGGLVAATTMAFLVLLLFFPRLHFDLLFGVSRVSNTLHSSASTIPLLYAGEMMDAGEGPRTYAHGFFLISTPLWMLFLLVSGTAFLLHKLIFEGQQRTLRSPLELLFLLLALFPWIYLLVFRTALHDGIRHMLWGIPPLVIIMGFGFVSLENWVRMKAYEKSWLVLQPVLLALVGLQIIALHQMHPYQYVSFNRMAGDRQTIPNRYESEYWLTATKHLLEALPATAAANGYLPSAESPVKVRVSGPLHGARFFVPDGFSLVDSFEEADFYVASTTFRADLLAEGEIVYTINRVGIPIGVIKKLRP